MTLRDRFSSLPPALVAGRLGSLRAALSRANCDALLVTKLENIAYLTGFTGSAALLLVTHDTALLTSDGRYQDQAAEQLGAAGVDAEIVIGRTDVQLEALMTKAGKNARLGLEARHVTWSMQMRIAKELATEIVPTAGLVEGLRVVKDVGELSRIELACDIADFALDEVKHQLSDAPTESEFAAELEYAMRRHGSDGPSFATIVASGPNGALPHARPTPRRIVEGDLVVVDFGATVDGYHSDVTRTFCIGEPSASQRRHIEAVAKSQQAGVELVSPLVSGEAVDRMCRLVLEELGYGEFFSHSTGHGVGREIHEAPVVGPGAADNLNIGTVVTVEPGAYLLGVGGVRIEDTLVVTEDGARPLTKSTKDYQL